MKINLSGKFCVESGSSPCYVSNSSSSGYLVHSLGSWLERVEGVMGGKTDKTMLVSLQ